MLVIGFDGAGNLHVGGGNTFGQFPAVGYVAVVSSDAVASALVGGLPTVTCAPFRDVLELDPEPANRFWYVSSNWVTGELYLTAYGETKVFVYGPLRGLSQAG